MADKYLVTFGKIFNSNPPYPFLGKNDAFHNLKYKKWHIGNKHIPITVSLKKQNDL